MTKNASDQLPIIVVGGGIGGVAAALALGNKGFKVLVLEQASALGEIGAGIQIGPNAFHSFDALGLGDVLRGKAVYIDNLVLMDAMSDERIAAIPLDQPFRERFGNPYAVVHRADLHAVLLDACRANRKIEIRVASQARSYDQDGASITVTLADGTAVKGRALIGADGLWSHIRRQMIDDGAPRVSGHTTYRSVIPTAQMPEDLRWNAATLWAGPKCHIVHYPLKGGDVFNLVATYHNDAAEPTAGKPVSHEEVRRGFEHICARVLKIIDHGTNWKLWVLCDRAPIQNWVDGRVALLGDAAHPTLQYFAQGACMALEDGVCLGETMDLLVNQHGKPVEQALIAYNKARAVRTARIQLGSRLIGEYIYHPDGAMADVRNATMRAKSPDDFYNDLQWLYGRPGSTATL